MAALVCFLFQLDQHNLGLGSDSQGRSPGAGAVARIDLEFAEAAQPVGKTSVDSGDEEVPRPDLASMGVTGKLEGDACLFSHG